jgi:hypothetical protein
MCAMNYQKVGRAGVLVLALLFTLIVFIPVGVYLQWSVPRDAFPLVCMYPLIGVSILVVALIVWRKSRTAPRMQWPMRVGAVCLLVFCAFWLIATSIPPIGRRIGPWSELRRMLVEKSQEVVEARATLSVPANRQLTREEVGQIERMVFDPAPAYTFPIINQTVHVRMMSTVPPYVGVDFGSGRRAVFDLATMVVIYVD